MVSQRQLEANRRNAQNSTGPKTQEGKATVAKNAIKHGILSGEAVTYGENQQVFEAFRDEMFETLAPLGAMELLLADRIVDCAWRMRRTLRLQRKVISERLEREAESALHSWLERRFWDRLRELGGEDVVAEDEQKKVWSEIVGEAEEMGVGEIANPPSEVDAFCWCSRKMELFSRYETTFERKMLKSLHELQRLQARRNREPVLAPMAFDVEVDVSAGDGGGGEGE